LGLTAVEEAELFSSDGKAIKAYISARELGRLDLNWEMLTRLGGLL
jgi:hypothetical protein